MKWDYKSIPVEQKHNTFFTLSAYNVTFLKMKTIEIVKSYIENIKQAPLFPKILVILIIIVLFILSFFIGKLSEKIKNSSRMKSSRNDAVKRSRAVLSGQITEQISPFLPDCPCSAADVRFVGKPVDFIAFPGMTEGKKIEEVLIIEVKTGTSQLSSREKEIKELIENGKVRYMEYYFSADK